MKLFKGLLFFILILVLVMAAYDYLIGVSLRPKLEEELADAFGMPFKIKGLHIPLLPPGSVRIDKIECLNPPGFKRKDHFTAEGIHLVLELKELKKKCIHIKRAHFKKALFAIESYMTPEGSRTNVWLWYHRMGLDEDDPPSMLFPKVNALPPNEAAAQMAQKGKWRVKIDRLVLDDGTFIFDDRREEEEHQWIFQKLKGYWTGFDFISEYTSSTFKEYIKLEGTFGANPPARFEGEGQCQFSDGDNFDVRTKIIGGSVMEYDFLLSGLPGEVNGGTFDLTSHGRCLESELQSEHILTLRSMRFATPTAMQKLLKYPFQGVLTLFQTHKTIELELRVNGYIGDSKFHFFSAFTKAFQKSLIANAKETIKGTTRFVAQTPDQVMSGLSKIGALLNDTFNALPLPRKNGNGNDEELE